MYTIELYIQGKRVDLFKDESVKLVDSIQNIRDIDKVFTAFSQTFSLPASKVNNQIFKHYYNFSIADGFDARKKVEGAIELNALPFRTGKIKLEGVDLKDRKAHTYRVTFYGDIVELKDKLGQDKLSDIDFSGFDKDYSSTEVLNSLQQQVTANTNIIVPLITHSQRLYYDSSDNTADTGNLHFHGSGGGNNNHGVKWNELKYAIRVNTILQQIELQYGLEFSTDFFRNQSVTEMHNMFLWLHRKSGNVEDLSGANTIETLVDFKQINSNLYFEIYNTTFASLWTTSQLISLVFNIQPASGYTTVPYGIRIEESGITVYNSGVTLTGVQIIQAGVDFTYFGGFYEVYVETSLDMQFSSARWIGYAQQNPNVPITSVSYQSPPFSATDVFRFNVSKQMPDMKILDFLTGLFKLFNLTAYVNKAGVIVVQTLDDFYSEGIGHGLGNKGIDITEYVETSSSQVNVALPFKEVYFKFEDTATFLANKFGEITNRPWGQISYKSDPGLDGGLYEIKVPFGHLQYERLNDVATGTLKDIQWGYNVNNDQSPYLGKPLLFYPTRVDTGGIGIVDEVNDDNVAISHIERYYIILPFNSVTLDPAVNNFQLNFFEETSEWTRNENGQVFTGSLFTKYYTNYIKSVFNPQQRLTKVSAYLPMSFLLNYKLSDRLVIADKQYKINSISTNLQTGKSDLELITDRIVEIQQFP
mgnify:CR=1 FL=1